MASKKTNVKSANEKKVKNSNGSKAVLDSSRLAHDLIAQLVEIRKQQSVSQAHLAEKMNKSQQAISRIEMQNAGTSLKTVCGMADLLGYELKLVPKTKENAE